MVGRFSPLKIFMAVAFVSQVCLAQVEERKFKARHDPAEQLFRRAPMAQSARSVVVTLASNLHAAFDTELARVHTIWKGEPLNLWGPPYSNAKSPFICDFTGETLFSFPALSPWFVQGKKVVPQFGGLRMETNQVWFEYFLTFSGARISILERVDGAAGSDSWTGRRTFRFPQGTPVPLRYLASVLPAGTKETNRFKVIPAEFEWSFEDHQQEYYLPPLVTEGNTEKREPMVRQHGQEHRAFLGIPSRNDSFSFQIIMGTSAEPLTIPPERPKVPAKRFNGSSERRNDSGDAFYRIEHFPLPAEAELIITGMDWLNEQNLAVCTWLGEIYIVENATGPIAAATYRRFARGLNEPLGLTVFNREIYVVQKGELTRVVDTDEDGEADLFECVNDDWGYSGNYHSYSFGPLITPENDLMVFVTGQRGPADLMYQGWAIRAGTERSKPFCSGLRVPHGWELYRGDIFVADNQGNWIGTCRLDHLQEGKFYGFPSSRPATKKAWSADEVAPPALWLPRALSPSASGIETVNTEAFGPFKGQMLIGDFQNSILMRAFLEKVNGNWQGAVFPFAKGFLSGVNRLAMGPDGKLYVGGGKRTWSTAAPKEYSLERVSYTGKIPFEVNEVRATKDGFELRFTKPVELESARDPENYLVKQFRYKYHEDYGSPEFDHEGKVGATETAVEKVELSADAKTVRLVIPRLKTGFVASMQVAINSTEDEDLRNDLFYYTLNERPN